MGDSLHHAAAFNFTEGLSGIHFIRLGLALVPCSHVQIFLPLGVLSMEPVGLWVSLLATVRVKLLLYEILLKLLLDEILQCRSCYDSVTNLKASSRFFSERTQLTYT
ncbi:hypothetical protein BsWGS_04392 [Bradybaena similaris]